MYMTKFESPTLLLWYMCIQLFTRSYRVDLWFLSGISNLQRLRQCWRYLLRRVSKWFIIMIKHRRPAAKLRFTTPRLKSWCIFLGISNLWVDLLDSIWILECWRWPVVWLKAVWRLQWRTVIRWCSGTSLTNTCIGSSIMLDNKEKRK